MPTLKKLVASTNNQPTAHSFIWLIPEGSLAVLGGRKFRQQRDSAVERFICATARQQRALTALQPSSIEKQQWHPGPEQPKKCYQLHGFCDSKNTGSEAAATD